MRADRTFVKNIPKFKYVDVNQGWLIFKLPPAEIAVHPSDENDMHELESLRTAGASLEEVTQQRWGRVTRSHRWATHHRDPLRRR
jgi:hypothetical protein